MKKKMGRPKGSKNKPRSMGFVTSIDQKNKTVTLSNKPTQAEKEPPRLDFEKARMIDKLETYDVLLDAVMDDLATFVDGSWNAQLYNIASTIRNVAFISGRLQERLDKK